MQVSIFNETTLDIFGNFFPIKTITCNDKDLIWVNEKIKSYMNSKTQLYKTYIKDCRNEVDFLNCKNYITELKEIVSIS